MYDNFISQVPARIKSERIKLGLSQAEAGDLCGISREMWGKYERGLSIPGGEVLFSFAAAGADVQYILTDVRSQKSSEVIEKTEDFLTKTKNDIEEIVDELELDDALDTLRFVQYRKRVSELVKEVQEMKKENLRKNVE